MFKILLAEDHVIVRNGIRLLLELQSEVEIIGEAGSGKEVIDLLDSGIVPEIILTDINMPQMDGIELIKTLKSSHPDIKIIVLSMLDNEKYVSQAFLEGCKGYLLKNVNEEELMFALRVVARGENYLCVELVQRLIEKLTKNLFNQSEHAAEHIDLSMREIEVLHLVAEGYTNQEMAEKLFLSKRTIEGHRQMLIDKTRSKNTAALIRFAVVNGYLN